MTFIRPDIIRPPSESRCYFLPLTSGCSNNLCSFCNYYGCKLQIRAVDEIIKEIDTLYLYMHQGIRVPDTDGIIYTIANEWDGKRIFLQDGDALVYPYAKLIEVLQYLNEKFPELERIACYATAKDILNLNIHELRTLNKLKLGILYMGVESGDDDILQSVNKNLKIQQIIDASKRIKESGLILSVTVILGLGGIQKSKQHSRATANILSKLDPQFVGALTLTLIPGTPLFEQYQRGTFRPISPFQTLVELKTIIENSIFSSCFFSSMHASNYLSIRGILPQNKAKMLSQLDYVLASQNPDLLRPEFLRGL